MRDKARQIMGKTSSRGDLLAFFDLVRSRSVELASPLTDEDCVIQSMPDASPTKWHLAHTTWFFETFVLKASVSSYAEVDPSFAFLFNSYYLQVGGMHERNKRGLVSRPSRAEVRHYRSVIDARIADLIDTVSEGAWFQVARLIELGLHHEQQHQELLMMDIKHVFWSNPLHPAYRSTAPLQTLEAPPLTMETHSPGLTEIGHQGEDFAFDNESPRHKHFVPDFQIAKRCVTNGEYAEFIADDGYDRAEYWLSDGWSLAKLEGWRAPLYWQAEAEQWLEFRLAGLQPIDPNSPVVHLSYFEADAYARWSGHRLPRESEWEVAARTHPIHGNFAESGQLHPRPVLPHSQQFFGDVWEFTASPYAGYPGYTVPKGAIGEYNGKFMSGQMVLRGGSCATPQSHMRATYRNFFHPGQRWGFQGLRLASDA